MPLALGVAIFLTEFAPAGCASRSAFLVELLAADPERGVRLVGRLRAHPVPAQPSRCRRCAAALGWTPFFKGVFYGNSMLAGGVILAIMIVPYIAAVSREVLLAVPATQREAALGLGATRWEAVWTAVLPYGRAGIIGAIMLGFGRALGETMAVTMVIGNRHDIGASLLAARLHHGRRHRQRVQRSDDARCTSPRCSRWVCVLFVITITINALARLLVWRVARAPPWGARRCERPRRCAAAPRAP